MIILMSAWQNSFLSQWRGKKWNHVSQALTYTIVWGLPFTVLDRAQACVAGNLCHGWPTQAYAAACLQAAFQSLDFRPMLSPCLCSKLTAAPGDRAWFTTLPVAFNMSSTWLCPPPLDPTALRAMADVMDLTGFPQFQPSFIGSQVAPGPRTPVWNLRCLSLAAEVQCNHNHQTHDKLWLRFSLIHFSS